MSTPSQRNDVDAVVDDQLMMEEIFELLAANSPSENQDETTTVTITNTSNSHNSHSSSTNLTDSTNGDEQRASFTGTGASAEEMEDFEEFVIPGAGQLHGSEEDKPPAEPGAVPSQLPRQDRVQSTPRTNAPPPLLRQATLPDATPFPSPELPLPRDPSSLPQTSGASHLLPTGQRLHVMNEAEFDELRRKLRMQTASRRYRKRKKEGARKKKKQVQELKAELARLQDIERQMKQYEQRSVESLEEELAKHKQEVADLSVKMEEAAKEERDWITTMKAHTT